MQGVVLQMKSLGITRTHNFPFPTPPDRAALVQAESTLALLGALDAQDPRDITSLGLQVGRARRMNARTPNAAPPQALRAVQDCRVRDMQLWAQCSVVSGCSQCWSSHALPVAEVPCMSVAAKATTSGLVESTAVQTCSVRPAACGSRSSPPPYSELTL
jgi:hypothetical protein